MNEDSISRQAAIDALNSLQKFSLIDSKGCLHGVGVRLKFAVQKFEQLPSAQPEIIRCKECKHNVGVRDNTGFYEYDIVCDYWESDGLYSTDFCSYGERVKR